MNIHMRARITLLLASCALAVPSANAMVVNDGQTYVSPRLGDDHARTVATTAIGTSGTFTSGDGHARATTPVAPPATLPVSAEPGGFDWNDAGLGFGLASGLALLAGGTLLTMRRPRHPRTPAI